MGKEYSWLAVAAAAANSVTFGYQVVILNSTIQFLTLRFQACGDHYTYQCDEAASAEALAVAAVVVGGTVGSLLAGPLANYSRRFAMMVTQVTGIIAGVFTMFASDYTQFAVARLLAGLCVGLVCVVAPTWISEFSPVASRGKRGVLHQLSVVTGILLANCVGNLLTPPSLEQTPDYHMSDFDRSASLALVGTGPAVYCAILLVIFLLKFRDDTPQMYVQNGEFNRAKDVLLKIYSGNEEDANSVLDSLKSATARNSNDDDGENKKNFIGLLSKPNYLYCLSIGLILGIGQQITGINAFVSQSVTIFREAGLSPESCVHMSIAMSAINFVMTFPAMMIIDKFGRKPLLLIGLLGMGISLSLPLVFWAVGKDYSMAAVYAVIGYIACFAFSYGPVLWVYLFEMFPGDVKNTAAGLCSAATWGAQILVVYFNRLYSSYVLTNFAVFTVSCAVLLFFVVFCLKETKGTNSSPYINKASELIADESKPLFEDKA